MPSVVLLRFAAAAAAFAAALAAHGATVCAAHSPAGRQALVELYTSEGCSSCPVADDWLARQATAPSTLPIVPLALHVDYWDGPGWTDRFAQHGFAERQRTLAARAGGRFVYTPEVAVGGREFGDWRDAAAFGRRVRALAAEPSPVGLALTAHAQASTLDVALDVTRRAATADPLAAYVALYENALVSEVRGGENRGATLHHERVVRVWRGPYVVSAAVTPAGAPQRVAERIALPDGATAAHTGIAAFVEDMVTGDVVQALDLPSCG
ncbi:DUF1223 domain-containing protein [Burkholderia guangdongensis]|uniref:DUF1223 domain-containing protein n=1 Tax=Burkholderia guangdongensis TaxID=1792500 RepID=UPI0015CCF78A|nr:DUF1223 domain-containing protein [Burkholderia guangdongensis]